jgi:crotonobetainyl-CoA:carnitine CoA-transferase CaiB-like acyl-CoA transferase
MMGVERFGNRYPAAILDVHQTKDGQYLLFTAQTDAQWESFLRLVGKEEIIAEKWDPHTRNIERRDEVEKWASEWARGKTLNEAMSELAEARLAGAEITKMSALERDPHVLARELSVQVEDPECGRLNGIRGVVPKLSETPGSPGTAEHVTELGQHSEEILTELLGYTKDEIVKLREEGIV